MKSLDVIKLLKQDRWYLARTKGSHHIFKHPDKTGRVVVPHPKRQLPKGTLRSIYKQAGWNTKGADKDKDKE